MILVHVELVQHFKTLILSNIATACKSSKTLILSCWFRNNVHHRFEIYTSTAGALCICNWDCVGTTLAGSRNLTP